VHGLEEGPRQLGQDQMAKEGQEEMSMSNIAFWQCCGKNIALGKKSCPACGAAQHFNGDTAKDAPKPEKRQQTAKEATREQAKRDTHNATARKLTKLNDVPGSFLISTLPGGPRK